MKEFYKVIPFVLARIENEKSGVLIGQHKDLPHKPYPLRWDLPGGKIEDHEEVEDCLIREIKEETGYDIVELKLCDLYHNFGDDPEVVNGNPGIGICYKVEIKGEFKPTEMDNMHYASTEELKKLKLTPWTKHFLRDLL